MRRLNAKAMTKTILLLCAIATAGIWLMAPNDAECLDCLVAGQSCYGDVSCPGDCKCYRPDGLGKPGFCS